MSNKYLKINNDYVTLNYIDGNYTVVGYLSNELEDKELENKVNYTIGEDNKIIDTIEETDGEVISNLIYDYNDYKYLYFNYDNYHFSKEFDNKWKDSLSSNVKAINKDNILINLDNLDDEEYYCVLEIRDLNNKVHYTKLEKIK